MDDSSFWHKVATGLLGLVTSGIAMGVSRYTKKVDELDDTVKMFPVKFISKEDCSKLHDIAKTESNGILTKMDIGFERVFMKLDALQLDVQERHERIRDLIDERTLK